MACANRHRRALELTRPWSPASGTRRDRLAGRRRAAPGPRRRRRAGLVDHAVLQHLPDPQDAAWRRREPDARYRLHRWTRADRDAVAPALRPARPHAGALRRSWAVARF